MSVKSVVQSAAKSVPGTKILNSAYNIIVTPSKNGENKKLTALPVIK